MEWCRFSDHFKSMMPEWKQYVSRDQEEAGTLCHRETGFLQEIAQETALRRRQNIWVDGSLKDGKWFTHVFQDIRKRFPLFRIAIFHVSVLSLQHAVVSAFPGCAELDCALAAGFVLVLLFYLRFGGF
eukprot:m.167735 g.167735  ORF g.167735 m.167735 type:complete len:128 (+) comp17776_c0_seq1:256-639(+)